MKHVMERRANIEENSFYGIRQVLSGPEIWRIEKVSIYIIIMIMRNRAKQVTELKS